MLFKKENTFKPRERATNIGLKESYFHARFSFWNERNLLLKSSKRPQLTFQTRLRERLERWLM
jgi:hypothetical protein